MAQIKYIEWNAMRTLNAQMQAASALRRSFTRQLAALEFQKGANDDYKAAKEGLAGAHRWMRGLKAGERGPESRLYSPGKVHTQEAGARRTGCGIRVPEDAKEIPVTLLYESVYRARICPNCAKKLNKDLQAKAKAAKEEVRPNGN